jgi:hypothetical protein
MARSTTLASNFLMEHYAVRESELPCLLFVDANEPRSHLTVKLTASDPIDSLYRDVLRPLSDCFGELSDFWRQRDGLKGHPLRLSEAVEATRELPLRIEMLKQNILDIPEKTRNLSLKLEKWTQISRLFAEGNVTEDLDSTIATCPDASWVQEELRAVRARAGETSALEEALGAISSDAPANQGWQCKGDQTQWSQPILFLLDGFRALESSRHSRSGVRERGLLLHSYVLVVVADCRWSLGVHAAINCQVSAGDIRRFRTGDECHHRGDLVNMAIAVECRGGLLRHRPIAGGGVQFRVDRTRLHVVDRDAPAPDFSGQRLSEHLDGSLRARVGHKPGRRDSLTHGRTDHDDATATLHVLQGSLRRDEYAADVDVDHAIHLFQGRLLERFRNGRAGIVHQDI